MNGMKRVIALLCLTLLHASPREKGNTMTQRASGSFEVQLEPIASEAFPRLALKKQFHGDLEGTSAGEMMSVDGTVEGSGAYVALERVTGTLGGCAGSFALVHNGTMRRGGELGMIVRIVPDSGTGELAGLTGAMEIVLEGRNHFYHLDYTLPES
jgi:hypothetical protein